MAKKSLSDLDVKGKKVFLRNDFNVPLDGSGAISDDTRLQASLPTIRELLEKGAAVICASHFGRPKGGPDQAFSLRRVAERLSRLLDREVLFCPESAGDRADEMKRKLAPAEIMLLENLRFNPGETKNDPALAGQLARHIDYYVNDAFGACHRAHASIAAICDFVPLAAAGRLLLKEIEYLSLALEAPSKKKVLILGGAKVADKIPVLRNLVGKAEHILIGGAMAYTFLRALGTPVGNSRVEEEQLENCTEILAQAGALGTEVLLPLDHITAQQIEPEVTVKFVASGRDIDPGMMGLDIGPETTELYRQRVAEAEMVVWNGPMGVFEVDLFSGGTMELAAAVAANRGVTIIGGGDTVAAVNRAGVSDRISHVSTGGGASLEFLAGVELPGIKSLTEK